MSTTMRDWTIIRERYMRDPLPVRLGGLAANLARVQSFSDHPEHRDVVESLLEESKYFIEWAAPEAAVDVQAALVGLQLKLACWQLTWPRIWADPIQRADVSQQSGAWSERVLTFSGLLG